VAQAEHRQRRRPGPGRERARRRHPDQLILTATFGPGRLAGIARSGDRYSRRRSTRIPTRESSNENPSPSRRLGRELAIGSAPRPCRQRRTRRPSEELKPVRIAFGGDCGSTIRPQPRAYPTVDPQQWRALRLRSSGLRDHHVNRLHRINLGRESHSRANPLSLDLPTGQLTGAARHVRDNHDPEHDNNQHNHHDDVHIHHRSSWTSVRRVAVTI